MNEQIVSRDDIEEFVKSYLTNNDLNKLFRNYKGYCHLLEFPIKPLTKSQKQKALINYLEYFIEEGQDEERPETLNNIVLERDTNQLIDTICGDQFYEEPLMHIINQGTKYYNLS